MLFAGILLLSGNAVNVFAQDTVSTAYVKFAPAPDPAKPVVKATDTAKAQVPLATVEAEVKAVSKTEEKKSLWGIFIAGLIGGFAAVLMPCIFPMLPMTVSYLSKVVNKEAME